VAAGAERPRLRHDDLDVTRGEMIAMSPA